MLEKKWQGSVADVYSHKFGSVARDFFLCVVEPSLTALNLKSQQLNISEEPAAIFFRNDNIELTNKTSMAFCLSIQSLWEQQIRRYLTDCVRYLKLDESILEIEKATWGTALDEVFYRIRGIPLLSFDSYATFCLLQMLANACRHGDGRSARNLWKAHPELWPKQEFYPFLEHTISPPSIQYVQITRELLSEFTDAIFWFWEDIKYEYILTINNGYGYECILEEMRTARSKRVKRTPSS